MADVDSKLEEAKGRVKEAAGDLTDNDQLKREGKADQASGKVKQKIDDAKDKIEEGVDAVKEKFNDKAGDKSN